MLLIIGKVFSDELGGGSSPIMSPLMKHCSTTTVKLSILNGLRALYEPESGECCAMLWNES